jgi:hypothetical protein
MATRSEAADMRGRSDSTQGPASGKTGRGLAGTSGGPERRTLIPQIPLISQSEQLFFFCEDL